jgi:hypothetical protein
MNRAHIDLRAWTARQIELFSVLAPCAPGSWVFGANVQRKRSVALQLEVPHHFIESCAGGRSGSLEPPATFGATKTPKMLLLDPYQFPAHGRLYRCAPMLSDRMPSTCLLSRDGAFSFRSGVLLDSNRKPPSLNPGVAEDA